MVPTEIAAAVITSIGAVFAALLGLVKSRHGKIDNVKNESQNNSNTSGSVAISISGTNNSVIQNLARAHRPSELRLVDLSVDDSIDGFPVLEVKVRNVGDEPAFLKQAVFEVLNFFVPKEFREINYSFEPVSWAYDVEFSQGPQTLTIPLSQTVLPNGVDRFTFRIGQSVQTVGLDVIARFELRLIYDESSKPLYSQPITVAIPPAASVVAFVVASVDEEIRQWNVNQLMEFAALSGMKSKRATAIFQDISPKQVDEPPIDDPSKSSL